MGDEVGMAAKNMAPVTPLRRPEPPATSPSTDDAPEGVLAPVEEFPRIDLRGQGEPWGRRRTLGKMLRQRVPHVEQGRLEARPGRPDPVELLKRSNAGRQEHLVPLRMARMAESPFAFLRGAASVMAWDLAQEPDSGIRVVLCGDAHLDNFGLFGTPEAEVVLDLNDFDETVIGPWEWDLKRLAASFAVLGRQNRLEAEQRRRAVQAAVEGYRCTMSRLAPKGALEVWNLASRAERLNFHDIGMDAASCHVIEHAAAKARRRDNAALLRKVGERRADGGWRLREDPPVLTRLDPRTRERVADALERYAETVPGEWRFLLQRYHVVDVAHRVVGVGSVGLRAYLALLFGNSDEDALFLQLKEAAEPAHAPYLPPLSEPFAAHQGHRVVYGQRLLQAVGDPLLGWTSVEGRPFYVRQMRNLKGSIPMARLSGQPFLYYAWAFGALLARGHARTGDAAAIAGYCGEGDSMDRALVDWAEAYADRTAEDHAALLAAIESGRVEARNEEQMGR